MNFLEQLVAEWYAYEKKHFVRTNIKFGKRDEGGYDGEIDVIAFDPFKKTLTHIETSTDAKSWDDRKTIFLNKFEGAKNHYKKFFDFDGEKVNRKVVVGFGIPKKKPDFGNNIEVKTIYEFLLEITDVLSKRNPETEAVPEGYPLLRAIQYSSYFELKNSRRKK